MPPSRPSRLAHSSRTDSVRPRAWPRIIDYQSEGELDMSTQMQFYRCRWVVLGLAIGMRAEED